MYTLIQESGAGQKIVDWLKEQISTGIPKIVSAVQKIIPIIWGAGSALTVLLTDDHDLKAGKKSPGKGTKKSSKKEEPKNEGYHARNNRILYS